MRAHFLSNIAPDLLPRYTRPPAGIPHDSENAAGAAQGDDAASSTKEASSEAENAAEGRSIADALAFDGPLSDPERQARNASADYDAPGSLSSEEAAALEALPPDQVAALLAKWPVQTLTAVNTVLFERHGYRACNR